MKGRKYYSSYSEALKRLNLITKEVNTLTGNKNNISLFTEGEEGEKKYFLKRNTNEQAPTPVPAPAPAPAPAPVPSPEPAPAPEEELPTDDMGMGDEMPEPDETQTEEPETVTFKMIQKLTGKLGQKLRTLNADEENKMSSKDIKYVINSILSALELQDLDEDDREEIMTKLEGEELGTEDSGMDMGEPGMEEPDMSGEEVPAEPPPAPETQEDYSSIDEYDEMEEDYSKMDNMIENIFSESKVDKILKKYFKLDEKERKVLKSKKEKRTLVERIIKNSDNIIQQVAARKLVNENKNIKFLGKSESNHLIFESNGKKIGVSTKGKLL
jgi:hypothetical protein